MENNAANLQVGMFCRTFF